MKQHKIFRLGITSMAGLCLMFASQAQTQDSAKYETLDINNINAKIRPGNVQFFPNLLDGKVGYGYPADMDSLTTFFSYALWIGGQDVAGQLRLSAEKYNTNPDDWTQSAADFQPGPINYYGSSDEVTIQQWNRVWKLSASEIQEFLTRIQSGENIDSNSVPEAIRTWPAHGDISKGQAANIAPFFDNDGDGIYNWQKGDYPLIKGDQCIFFVYNDARPHERESRGEPMNIEIHAMAYAFGDPSDTAFRNSMFFNYTIHNRSVCEYNDVFIGVWADIDIGYAYDDYIECDVERGMFYGYNGKYSDGYGLPTHYGEKVPAQGVAILGGAYIDPDGYDNPSYNKVANDNIFGPSFNANFSNPCDIVTKNETMETFTWDSTGNGDTVTQQIMIRSEAINGLNFGDGIIDNERLGMRGFVYHDNDNGIRGNPTTAIDYYNYLRGMWKNNARMTFGGTGYNPSSTTYCDFMFPGYSDPCDWGTNGLPVSEIWREENCGNMYGDRRGLGSTGPFNLKAGTSTQLDIALISGMPDDGGTSWSAVGKIKGFATQIRTEFSIMPEKFQNNNYGYVPVGVPVFQQNTEKTFTVYPNPVSDILYVELHNLETAYYTIYNVTGQIIQRGIINKTANIDVQNFSKGIYYVRIAGKTVKVIKN
ncbi:MAG: T9SS type A sorting domain-containing protein [Lentimicrobiaceae bacterium]|nr:T9SS type A sorting domain-containing protein [Lentimicrobiaceae bacterium]